MTGFLQAVFSDDNSRVSTQFVLSVFCALSGFLAAVGIFLIFGIKFMLHPTIMCGNPPVATMGDIPPNITAITQAFIVQTIGGTVASVFYKPRIVVPPEGGTSPAPVQN